MYMNKEKNVTDPRTILQNYFTFPLPPTQNMLSFNSSCSIMMKSPGHKQVSALSSFTLLHLRAKSH